MKNRFWVFRQEKGYDSFVSAHDTYDAANMRAKHYSQDGRIYIVCDSETQVYKGEWGIAHLANWKDGVKYWEYPG